MELICGLRFLWIFLCVLDLCPYIFGVCVFEALCFSVSVRLDHGSDVCV
jgi:hypothetical protein